MRYLRRTVVATFAVALCAAPAASAHDPQRGGGIVTPSNERVLNRINTVCFSLPIPENPCTGPLHGDHCVRVGHKLIQIVGPFTCTVKQGTALAMDVGTVVTSLDDPFSDDEAVQRATAVAADRDITGFRVIVDGDKPVDARRPRFELFPPQQTVQLPEDNIFDDPENNIDVPARTITFTAHGWGVIVRNLRPGRHTIVGEADFPDGTFGFPHTLIVVPRGHHDRD